jgi:hypothetical protein
MGHPHQTRDERHPREVEPGALAAPGGEDLLYVIVGALLPACHVGPRSRVPRMLRIEYLDI